jgi:hypothetical protein
VNGETVREALVYTGVAVVAVVFVFVLLYFVGVSP